MRDLPLLLLDGTGPQRHPEGGPAAGRVFDPHRPPTRLDEPAHDREPETHPRLRAVRVGAVEALEDLLAHLRRHAVATVHHREHDLLVRRLHGDAHRRLAVLVRVLDQVGDDAPDRFGVGAHLALGRRLDLDRAPRDLGVERREPHQRGEVDAAQQRAVALLLHLGGLEDLLDHRLQPHRLALDDVEQLDPLLGRDRAA
jgi:hypothetical protein